MAEVIVTDRKTGHLHVATVDDADLLLVSAYRWYLYQGYAHTWLNHPTKRRHVRGKGWKRVTASVPMHRVILDRVWLKERIDEIDHRNRIRLDCRRENLRIVSHAANMQNRGPHRPIANSQQPQSSHRGVCWDPSTQKWRAIVQVAGVVHRLGLFIDEHAAGLAAANKRAELMPFSSADIAEAC